MRRFPRTGGNASPVPGMNRQVWRRVAMVAVMTLHTAVFLGIAASILHIFYAGVSGRPSRWTRIAITLSLAECAVFVAYRFRCPLRTIAESLGAESGQVTDIFLPRWLADRIPWVFTPLLVAGIGGLIRNRSRQARRPDRPAR